MGRKILLADDSITIQKVVNLTFSDEGIDVVTVGNGELAVRKLNDVRPDIVLADIYMPGKNGYEVCEYIKTNPQFSHIPVLLLVGAFEPFDQAESDRVKADGHLTKPFESRALVATVTRLLAQAPTTPLSSMPSPSVAQPASNLMAPPDSTTTKLSPELAARYQASFSTDPPVFSLDMPRVEPMRANPVPPEPYQPPMASPASHFTPPMASPVPGYQPPKASPVPAFEPPKASPVPDFQPPKASPAPSPYFDTPVINEANYASANTSSVAPSFELDFSMDSAEPSVSYNTSPSSPFTTGSPYSEPVVDRPPMNFDATNFDEDEMERTKIMGSPLRKNSSPAPAYTPPPMDNLSPLELDDMEITGSGNSGAHSPVQDSDVQYEEEIMPLDLEPLDEINYQSNSNGDSLLEIAEPMPMEELPPLDSEEVLETDAPGNVEVNRGEAVPSFDLDSPLENVDDNSSEPLELDITNAEPKHITSEIEMNRTTGTMFDPVVDKPEVPEEADMMPSELRHAMASAQPSVIEEDPIPVSEPGYQEEVVSKPQESVIEEEFNREPLLPRALPGDVKTLPQWEGLHNMQPVSEFEETADNTALAEPPTAFTQEEPGVEQEEVLATDEELSKPVNEPLDESITEPVAESIAYQPAMPVVHYPTGSESAVSEPVVHEPVHHYVPEPVAESPILVASSVVTQAVPTVAVPSSVPVTITSIDQIPQHIIDEITRRAIAQLSENIVREIAWEVVPDLAELLIKKRLSENH